MAGRGWTRALALTALLASAFTAGAQEPTAPWPRAGEHAGTAECVRCHEGQHRKLLQGPHRALDQAPLPGCETCHGPGKAHASDEGADLLRITMPPKLAAAAQEASCGRCHPLSRHGGDMEGLRAAGKRCTDCHEIHTAPVRKAAGEGYVGRINADAAATAVGAAACLECHPRRDALLHGTPHAALSAHARADGCESCHGHGSAHVQSQGQARWITRPDRAADGVATCRSCHADVDAQQFHWRGKKNPYLGAGLVCATCHHIHTGGDAAAEAAPHEAATNWAATNRACAECHVPALCTMPGSTHGSLGAPDVPLERGCGACHAGGLEHARAGGKRELVQRLGGTDAAAQAGTCLQCHRDDRALAHSQRGAHQRAGVGCAECHGPLHGADPTSVTVDAEQSCKRCHAAVDAEFKLPNRHPVPEGHMRCSSCHDVHGDRRMVRNLELAQGRCVKCHAQYRGPFVFAHQAGRRDGCIICHEPHGSSNRRMLQQASTQQNCIACHGDFPAFHDQTQGAVFTNCLRCHTEVHGSNHSRFLFR